MCDVRCDLDGGARIQEKKAGAAREDVFDGEGHFMLNGPLDMRKRVGQIRGELFLKFWAGACKFLHSLDLRSVSAPGILGVKPFFIAEKFQLGGAARAL